MRAEEEVEVVYGDKSERIPLSQLSLIYTCISEIVDVRRRGRFAPDRDPLMTSPVFWALLSSAKVVNLYLTDDTAYEVRYIVKKLGCTMFKASVAEYIASMPPVKRNVFHLIWKLREAPDSPKMAEIETRVAHCFGEAMKLPVFRKVSSESFDRIFGMAGDGAIGNQRAFVAYLLARDDSASMFEKYMWRLNQDELMTSEIQEMQRAKVELPKGVATRGMTSGVMIQRVKNARREKGREIGRERRKLQENKLCATLQPMQTAELEQRKLRDHCPGITQSMKGPKVAHGYA